MTSMARLDQEANLNLGREPMNEPSSLASQLKECGEIRRALSEGETQRYEDLRRSLAQLAAPVRRSLGGSPP